MHTVVGALAEFRPDPVPYDPAALVRFVRGINPDLLGLDMTTQQWKERDFGGLPTEYRDALLPLAEQSDIVVVNERCLKRFLSAAELIMGILPRYEPRSPDCTPPWHDDGGEVVRPNRRPRRRAHA